MSDIDRRRGKYVARWRSPDGRQHSKAFGRAGDAKAWLAEVEHSVNRGTYTDPRAGKLTLSEYASTWLASQTTAPTTREGLERRWRLHILPTLGAVPLAGLRPSAVRSWLAGMQRGNGERSPLSAGYIRECRKALSAALAAAVLDGLIPANPALGVKGPRVTQRRVVPWSAAQVAAVRAALPPHYRAMVDVAAGCGLRQSEVFGLRVGDVDFLRHVVHVRQAVKVVGNRITFGLPKGERTRDVPLPDSVGMALAEHLAVRSTSSSSTLIFTNERGEPFNRSPFNATWRKATAAAGVTGGFHQLRHGYASNLLAAGVDLATVAAAMGDREATVLAYYSHMIPDTGDRIRQAIDQAAECAPDVREGLPAIPSSG
jgi:integrase